MIRLFGTPVVERLAVTARLPERTFVLLALMRLAYFGSAKRSAIAETLWEDNDAPHANMNMRQLLLAIRKWETESGHILIGATHLDFYRDSRHLPTDLDLLLFADDIRTQDQLKGLISLYRGDLLEGLGAMGPALETWVREQQLELSDRFSRLAITGAAIVGGSAAEEALRTVIARRPYDEVACRALMEHLKHRSRDESLRVFERFHRRLFDDLHLLPSAETTELARELRRRSGAPFPAVSAVASKKAGRASAIPRVLILQPQDAMRSVANALLNSMIEDVTLNLCRMREFAVIAPHSAAQMDFVGRGEDLDLWNADYVVTTKVGAESRRPILEVKLVRTASAEVLWFEPISLDTNKGADRLHEVANWLSTIVATSVQQAEVRELRSNPGDGAYRHYLMGRKHLREISLQGVRRGRKWFRSATEIDDQFAPAFSWLAQSYILEWMIFSHGSTDLLHEAAAAARRAIEVDPLDGNGHRALGRASLFLGRLDESLEFFISAERFAPHHADMLADYADTLMHNSRPLEAKERIVQALDLNPFPPDVYRWIAGGIDFFNGEPKEALSQLRRMSKPDQALRLMAACAAMAGETEEAFRYRKRALEFDPDFRIDTWTSRLPLRERSHVRLYSDALRAAGFV